MPTDDSDGVKALLTLAATLFDGVNTNDSEALLEVVGHVAGVCQYLHEFVLGVDDDNEIYIKALLEGIEMSLVFASNFAFNVPGVVWVSIHQDHPGEGGEPLTPTRTRTYMIDVHGSGEYMNISNINFEFKPPTDKKMNFVGMWDSPEEGTLLDCGSMRVSLDLTGRDVLSLAPGGLRTRVAANTP